MLHYTDDAIYVIGGWRLESHPSCHSLLRSLLEELTSLSDLIPQEAYAAMPPVSVALTDIWKYDLESAAWQYLGDLKSMVEQAAINHYSTYPSVQPGGLYDGIVHVLEVPKNSVGSEPGTTEASTSIRLDLKTVRTSIPGEIPEHQYYGTPYSYSGNGYLIVYYPEGTIPRFLWEQGGLKEHMQMQLEHAETASEIAAVQASWRNQIGFIYSVRRNSWHAVPQEGAPTAREEPTLGWLNGEFLVWGGTEAPTEFEDVPRLRHDGALYDPVKNSWRPMSSAGAPSERYIEAHFAGPYLIVLAREEEAGSPVAAYLYSTVTDRWSDISQHVPLGEDTDYLKFYYVGDSLLIARKHLTPYYRWLDPERGRYTAIDAEKISAVAMNLTIHVVGDRVILYGDAPQHY